MLLDDPAMLPHTRVYTHALAVSPPGVVELRASKDTYDKHGLLVSSGRTMMVEWTMMLERVVEAMVEWVVEAMLERMRLEVNDGGEGGRPPPLLEVPVESGRGDCDGSGGGVGR